MNARKRTATDLVGRQEIADRADVALVTVDKWRDRHDDFPTPTVLAGGPVWEWSEVVEWLHTTRRTGGFTAVPYGDTGSAQVVTLTEAADVPHHVKQVSVGYADDAENMGNRPGVDWDTVLDRLESTVFYLPEATAYEVAGFPAVEAIKRYVRKARQ